MEKERKYIKSFIYTIFSGLISGVLLANFKEILPINTYTIVVVSFSIMIMITYYPYRNPGLYSVIIPFILSNYISFVYYHNDNISNDILGVSFIVISALLFIQILSIAFSNINNSYEELLFDVREKDLDNIARELKLNKVLGINGLWGEGKTFLMHILKERLKDEYYFISINSLNINVDKLHIIILNEFDAIMKENGIFSKYSNVINSLFDNSLPSKAMSSFFMAFNYTDSRRIDGLKNELALLDKPIVLVFEDIDRLNNAESIIKIFSLANHIADYSDNIKIVYEYDSKVLHDNHSLDQNFLEKYISHDVNLANLTFLDTLKGLFYVSRNKYFNVNLSDFEFMYKERFLYIGKNQKYSFIFLEQFCDSNISVRRIKSFVEDINNFYIPFSLKKLFEDKNITIVYYYIKHFLPSTYSLISREYVNLLQVFPIEWHFDNGGKIIKRYVSERELSRLMYLGNASSIDMLLDIGNNRLNLVLLSLLGYDFRANLSEDDAINHNSDYINIPIDLAKSAGLYYNKMIMSRLKHLHQPAIKAETKEESLVNNLKETVFSCSEDSWQNQFDDFILNDLYYKDLDRLEQSEKEKLILNRIAFTTMSMFFSNTDIKTWHNWIDLVFPIIFYKDKDILDRDLLVILLYSNMEEKSIFLKCIAYFNTIKINTAFDDLKVYHKFLIRYFSYICKEYVVESKMLQAMQNLEIKDELEAGYFMSNTIENIKEEIVKRDNIVSQEKESILKFIDKNIEILIPFAGEPIKLDFNKVK